MVFLHRMRRGRTVIEASRFIDIQLEGHDGMTRMPKWGKTVEYEPMGSDDYKGFSLRGKNWRGTKDVTDPKLASTLMTHPRYGVDFIALSDEGTGEADLKESFFRMEENGTVYCWLTDRSFVNQQGAYGHSTSKTFTEAVETYLTDARHAFT